MAEDIFGNYMATNEEIAALEKKDAKNDKKRNAVNAVALYIVICFGMTLFQLAKPDIKTGLSLAGMVAFLSILGARQINTAFFPPLIPKSYTLPELWALVLADKQK